VTDGADARLVPAREGRGEVREKASRFFGIAAPAAAAPEAEEILGRIRREHHDATHVAFAWKIGGGASPGVRASDAGEPAGTAGRPIAGAIEAAGLSDVVVGVVRYYGGTNLGTGGLVRCYREAAALALSACGSRTVYETVRLEARPTHAAAGAVRRLLRPPEIRLASERFDPEPVLELEVRRSLADGIVDALTEARIAVRRLD
jgi:putative IMPACT (imprinted ancient) family translation regulator